MFAEEQDRFLVTVRQFLDRITRVTPKLERVQQALSTSGIDASIEVARGSGVQVACGMHQYAPDQDS
jgi:hypothetical protein